MSSVHLHTVSDHASLLLVNLNSMRKKLHLCDVVLHIQDKRFPAHKAVLAGCSQWFYSKFVDQLQSPRLTLSNSAQPCIISLNELTLKGFEPILEFAYTSRIRLTSSNVFDILSAASYLQMHKLMADCTSFMRSNVEIKFREPTGGNGRGSEAEVTSNFSPPHAGSPLLNTYEAPGTLSEESMGEERNHDNSRVSPNGDLNVSEGDRAQINEEPRSTDGSDNSRPHSNQSSADKQSVPQSPRDSAAAQEPTVTVKMEQSDEDHQPTCAQPATSQRNTVSNSGILSSESSDLEHHFDDGGSLEDDLHRSNRSDPNFIGSVVYPISLHTVGNLWPDQSERGAAGNTGTKNTAAQDTGTEPHDVMDQMATLQQQARNSFLEFQDKEDSTSSPYFPQGFETGESSNLRNLLTNQEPSSSGSSVIRDLLSVHSANATSMVAPPSVGRDAWFHSPEMVASMGLEGVLSTMTSSPMASRMMAPNPNKTLQPYREKRVTCSICKSQFNMIGHLKQHLLQVHSHCPKLYLCDTCGAQFDDVLKLSNHLVTHKGRFSCQFCGKRCSQLSSLYAHERTHTGERPYHCQSCGKSFRNKSHLNRHRLIHTGVKSYQCNLCMKKFTRREGLKLHMPKHAEEHPYLCHICLKAFSQQDQFTRHKAQHNTRGLRTHMDM
ncbi:ZNF582 [Branchiostoma lanceolatum]|uniref:ZNF582 protein n=1 Tax=Branchiostoma lanceolatum TaxID=7740 RepID=A0A8J9YZK5_BRALA|nr:ZNF582 [Branchiostoma lanceolatum]